jgi:hypothetical protein
MLFYIITQHFSKTYKYPERHELIKIIHYSLFYIFISYFILIGLIITPYTKKGYNSIFGNCLVTTES